MCNNKPHLHLTFLSAADSLYMIDTDFDNLPTTESLNLLFLADVESDECHLY